MLGTLIKIIKSQMVELTVTNSTQSNFSFVDQPQLRGMVIDWIETFNVLDIPISPSNFPLVSADTMSKSFLTLFLGYTTQTMAETVKQIPLVSLHRSQTTTASPFVRAIPYFDGQVADWAKCYVQTGGAIGFSNVSYLFNVGYHQPGTSYTKTK